MSQTVRPINGRFTSDARSILEDAIAQEFDTVIVFGYRKADKTVSHRVSATISDTEVIGAIERAKFVLMTTMEDG